MTPSSSQTFLPLFLSHPGPWSENGLCAPLLEFYEERTRSVCCVTFCQKMAWPLDSTLFATVMHIRHCNVEPSQTCQRADPLSFLMLQTQTEE